MLVCIIITNLTVFTQIEDQTRTKNVVIEVHMYLIKVFMVGITLAKGR